MPRNALCMRLGRRAGTWEIDEVVVKEREARLSEHVTEIDGEGGPNRDDAN